MAVEDDWEDIAEKSGSDQVSSALIASKDTVAPCAVSQRSSSRAKPPCAARSSRRAEDDRLELTGLAMERHWCSQ
jgi:hypothetical protein